MKVMLDGVEVEARKLNQPVGQFNYWYMNKHGEPRFLIIREAEDQTFVFNEGVNQGLTAAMASGRYMIAIFSIEAGKDADQKVVLHRTAENFPFDAFHVAKKQFCDNLDEEYTPPRELDVADLARLAGDMGPEGVPPLRVTPIIEDDANDKVHEAMNNPLVKQLEEMNAVAEANGTAPPNPSESPPTANVVEE